MTAHIVLFPATARLGEVERIAGNMLGMAPAAAENYLVRHLAKSIQRARQIGVAEVDIDTNLGAFENAVRAATWRMSRLNNRGGGK